MVDAAFQPDWFSKPGDTLLSLMEHRELTCEALAERVGRSHTTIQGLIAGIVDIDDDLALSLAEHVGGTPTFWRKRQSVYTSALSRAAEAVPKQTGVDWLKQFPHTDIVNYGWIAKPKHRNDLLKTYLAYFGVNNPSEWSERYTKPLGVSFRTSPTFKSKAGALSAWLRRGELEASEVLTAKWDADLLRSRLNEIRILTKAKTPGYFLPRVRRICAEAGVALLFVRAPTGCRASGATRFISPHKAMVILSFRHLSDDHFWFTLFHELGHVLLHGNATTFIDGEINPDSQQEKEANDFSASVLIPPARRDELLDLKPRKEDVIRFALSIGVSPGIVVGQMQHSKAIKSSQLNFLKRRFNWDQISTATASL